MSRSAHLARLGRRQRKQCQAFDITCHPASLSPCIHVTLHPADELTDFGNSVSNTVTATWDDASGFVQGTVENVTKGVKKFLGGLF